MKRALFAALLALTAAAAHAQFPTRSAGPPYACEPDKMGDRYYDTTTRRTHTCDGAAWRAAAPGLAFPHSAGDPFACSAAGAGQSYYNTTSNKAFTCNGTTWGELINAAGAAGAVTPGTTTATGCTSQFLISNADSELDCSAAFVANETGAGDGVFTVRKTPTGATELLNYTAVTGTMPTGSTVVWGNRMWITGTGSASSVTGVFNAEYRAGYTGDGSNSALRGVNRNLGTGTVLTAIDTWPANNVGTVGRSVATTTGSNVGVFGQASGGNENAAGVFVAGSTKNSATNVGLIAYGRNDGSSPTQVGAFIGNNAAGTDPTFISSALQLDNSAKAVPILVAQDNGAALPSTGATATFQLLDGAVPQSGPLVLTSATMTAEHQGQLRSGFSAYTWSNAQVAALSGTSGDITVATLPAKTQVKNVYVVITGQAAGPTTVTVSCGDAIGGTPFINYIVASNAKAAANTVYGDAVAERGTSIDVEHYYLPSYTATTLVTCQFISTGANLSTVTGSTGRVILETALLP